MTSHDHLRTGLRACLVGPFPPPSGGVSTHIDRLVTALTAEGVAVTVLNHFKNATAPNVVGLNKNPLRYAYEIGRRRVDLTHYHHSRFDTLIAAAAGLSTRSGHRVITLHSHRIERELDSPIPGVRAATVRALRRFDTVIAVSDALAAVVLPVLRSDQRLEVVPAYLPATPRSPVPPAPRPTLVVSAYQLGDDPASDVYGLDLACEAFRWLAERGDWALSIYLAQAPRSRAQGAYLEHLRRRLAMSAASTNVTIHIGEPLLPALRGNTVYLRPTTTDGDAVSVREALQLGVPVLASDAADRPAGVSVMTSRAPEAWAAEAQRRWSLPPDFGSPGFLAPDPTRHLLDLLLPSAAEARVAAEGNR